jgi:hypothetical protein
VLSPRGQLRRERWESGDGQQPPFTECLRADIADASWGCYRVPPELSAAIRTIDPRFELIYDPFTLPPGDRRPAFFLYSVKFDRNGGRDALRLEIPLQWDMEYAWPDGGPRAPGAWLVDAYRRHDNARLAGSPGYVERLRIKHRYEAAVRAQALRDAPLIAWQNALDEEFDPYLNRGRISPALCQDGTQVPNRRKRKVMSLPAGRIRVGNIVVPSWG